VPSKSSETALKRLRTTARFPHPRVAKAIKYIFEEPILRAFLSPVYSPTVVICMAPKCQAVRGVKNGSSAKSVGKKRDEMMMSLNINRYWGEKSTS